jgi:predicted dehydrogenase
MSQPLNRVNRRNFLGTLSGAAVGYWAAGRTEFVFSKSPNERLSIAGIGVGGKGKSDIDQAGKFGDVVAICDIDDVRLNDKAQLFPQAKRFNDYRELLDEMGDKLDAVVVSTPDHHHAPAAIRAMRLGKHVYCQKPLTHTPAEARLMRETARKYNVQTQMGNQGTANDGFRAGIELVRSGAVGPIREVHAWTNRPFDYWKQAPDIVARPTETPPIPPHVHWDLFLGAAPERPYHPVYHPHNWRGWWDFGTGSLGDMACHTANLAFMSLQLGLPERVSAISGEVNSETYPAWATMTYEFPARGDAPPVKFTWSEGAKDGQRNLPAADLLHGEEVPGSGMIFIGAKGSIFTPSDYGSEQVLLPRKEFAGFKLPEPTIERLGNAEGHDTDQKREWIRAIQGGPAPMSNFDYASRMTESMLLGNVAVRLGKALEYDGETGKVTNCPEAEQYIHGTYRKGWEIG